MAAAPVLVDSGEDVQALLYLVRVCKSMLRGGYLMRMVNEAGQAVYYNCVEKHGTVKFVILAASGQYITGRDRQKRKSRTFTHQHQAESWLSRNGYKP